MSESLLKLNTEDDFTFIEYRSIVVSEFYLVVNFLKLLHESPVGPDS